MNEEQRLIEWLWVHWPFPVPPTADDELMFLLEYRRCRAKPTA